MDFPWAGFLLLAVCGVCKLLVLRIRRNRSGSHGATGKHRTLALRRAQHHPLVEDSVLFMGALFTPVASVAVLLIFVARLHYVPSQSMLPGLPDGSVVLAVRFELGIATSSSKRIFVLRPLRRGDIVVFRYPLNLQKLYIKRVIGLPGDTVRYDIAEGFSLNGRKIPSIYLGMFLFPETGLYYPRYRETLGNASYVVETYDARHRPHALEPLPSRNNADTCMYSRTAMQCVLPDGYYFMAGDNRDRSEDSRAWGLVPAGVLVGRVVAKFR